jgi:hypothetical protein
MSTLRTVSKGAGLDLRKLAPVHQATVSDGLRTDLAAVTDDLTGGCAAGATLTGPTRTFTGGQRVIVAGWASAPGSVIVETSSDGGSTWPNTDSEAVLAGETVQGAAATVGGANRYRIKFTCGPVGASKVAFSSQARA